MNTSLRNNMKNPIKKGDIIIIIFVLFFAGTAYALTLSQGQGEYVHITANGETVRYPLKEDRIIELSTGKEGYNTIVIRNHEVYMENASCQDQICVHHKAISKNRESIICLPNEVYVEVESGSEKSIDN